MKNWKDISDNEFDELFKKASQSIKPEMRDGLWFEFKPKLDEANIEPKNTFINKRNLLIFLGVLLFAGLVGTNMYWNSNEIRTNQSNFTSIDQKSNLKNVGKKQIASLEEKPNTRKEVLIANDDQKIEVSSIEKSKNATSSYQAELRKTGSTSNSTALGKVLKNEIKNENLDSRFQNNEQLISSMGNSSNKGSNTSGLKTVETINNNTTVVSKSDENELANELDYRTFKVEILTRINGISPQPIIAENQFLHTPADYNRIIEKIEISKDRKFENKIYLTVGVSPDFSKVLDNSFLKMGYNWSTQLEYHLNKRWSLQSGVILSEKYYSSTPSGISWPTRWGTIPKELKGMEGTCKVVDIPLNIRYNIKNNDVAKMYIVGGVSSFILLNENYSYLYPEGFTFQGIKTKWARKDKEFLAAGMANFAIGYERKLGNVFSVQIEPFVKIPTREFGFTQVKLASTGVFVTAKARLK